MMFQGSRKLDLQPIAHWLIGFCDVLILFQIYHSRMDRMGFHVSHNE